MNNNFFSKFTPKNNNYFQILSQMADAVSTISVLNLECIQAKNHDEIVEYSNKIKQQKHAGSLLQNQIFEELNNTFITPFDREDISSLALNIKETIDYISSCAKRIMLYSPKYMPEDAKVLAELVKESSDNLKNAIDDLKSLKKRPKKIAACCRKLNEIESKADEVYENFLIHLFKNEKDSIEIVKLKDILHELEHATDAADHVGKVIRTISVKYA